MRLLLIAVFAGAPALWAQGVVAEWDIRPLVDRISANTQRLLPILNEVKPTEWIAKGAPEAYVKQFDTTRALADGVRLSADEVRRKPEKLTAAIDLFLRLQSLEVMLGSLAEGVRKYQNPAMSELLLSMVLEDSNSRDQLRQYVVDLADLKEKELAVMDREAQRCRESIVKQPPAKK